MDRVHYGIHKDLEAAADEYLRQAVSSLPRSQKMDILTPWKERDRLSREVYNVDGIPDSATRSGLFGRAWNPRNANLNSRNSVIPMGRTEEITAYFPEASFSDRAGPVYSGPLRSQAVCRMLSWGRTVRLQCPPCRRYLAAGPEVTCRKCGTVYLSEELFGHV